MTYNSKRPAPARPYSPRSRTAPRTVPVAGPARYPGGPVAVIDAVDGLLVAYGAGDKPLPSIPDGPFPALLRWAVDITRLGMVRLHEHGRDFGPLLVLSDRALTHYDLPFDLAEDGLVPADHRVHVQLAQEAWQVSRRGLGAWSRLYQAPVGPVRRSVQVCVPGWGGLDARHWGEAALLPPGDLARLLGLFSERVMTPAVTSAATGIELMTALRPPTRPGPLDPVTGRRSALIPVSLGTEPMDPPPCEAPAGHPVLGTVVPSVPRGPADVLQEGALGWSRVVTDAEVETARHVIGLDVNMAFAAAANDVSVGLATPPVHTIAPVFDARIPGSWLVDLSHTALDRVTLRGRQVDLDPSRLPHFATADGTVPSGPAWYTTPTLAYAAELGFTVEPVEAWLRHDHGPYLKPWYQRLRNAYVTTLTDLGVPTDPGADPAAVLAAYARIADPAFADPRRFLLHAIKATAKGAIGKLAERRTDPSWRHGQPWAALSRPTWRPDIRAAVIARSRIGLHRKIVHHAAATGRYPVSVAVDCVVYPTATPMPVEFTQPDGVRVPGGWRIGTSPGHVKVEGVQTLMWAEAARERYDRPVLNLAAGLKTGRFANLEPAS
ncbi:telomere-associated protein Tap (plasmid) [Streptomyces sp. BI20]|uniref:telomere-associated protein Tap n=1 Tax=Streptomyces sp. BI20 TaxID=3403460 RepID=UPI003C75CBC6